MINNSEVRVTGGLMHHDGRFMQYLAGLDSNVRRIISEIKRDTILGILI
jgi:hypothetical protein